MKFYIVSLILENKFWLYSINLNPSLSDFSNEFLNFEFNLF